VYLVADV
jgi:hypothetical protein